MWSKPTQLNHDKHRNLLREADFRYPDGTLGGKGRDGCRGRTRRSYWPRAPRPA